MAKKIARITADVVDTKPITVAGADTHPAGTRCELAERITTPLLPDDYLKLANPLWSARELRGRVLRGASGDRRLRDAGHQAGLGLSASTISRVSTSGIGLLVDGRWRWRSYSLTSSPVTRCPHGRRSL